MPKAQRLIDHGYFTSIPKFRAAIRTLPEGIQTCPKHSEAVNIIESERIPNPGDGAPFAKAAFTGCCDRAIDEVVERLGIRHVILSPYES